MADKKILDDSPVSGIAVPIAIVLVGALIIWGVTQMLSSGRNHKDLVNDLQSKTFGNRWVAAYELSKYIASSSVPEEDIPWMIENLGLVYEKAEGDSKTRNFVVIAMGGMDTKLSLPYLTRAVADEDKEISFNAIVALGKIEFEKNSIDWTPVIEKLESEDMGIVQVSLITLAQHEVSEHEDKVRALLSSEMPIIRYTAAQTLITMSQNRPEGIVEEMINLSDSSKLNAAQVESIKLNLIYALSKKQDSQSKNWLKMLSLDSNIKISTKAIQFLNLLK